MLGLAGFMTPATPAHAAAGINKTLNFQGRLLTSGGAVVADGNYNFRMRIYQDGPGNVAGDTGGTLMWTELWQNTVASGSTSAVVVKNGYFSISMASYCAFSGGSCQGTSNTSVDFNQDTLWLSMDVGGTAVSNTPTYDGELLPMRRMASAVYALQADNANKLGGLTSTQYLQLAQGVQTDSSTTNASLFVNKTGVTANILDIQRGGADVLLINNAGQSLFRPTTDSQTALQVQKAGTSTVAFTVDTVNSRIGIGLNNPSYAVDAVGSLNASVSVKIAGTDVCTASGCVVNPATAIQNQNSSQQTSANFWISGTGRADTALLSPSVDSATSVAFSLGSLNANAITVGRVNQPTTFPGDVKINGTSTTAANYRLQLNGTLNSSSILSQYGFDNELNFNPSGASVGNIYGLVNTATLSGSSLNVAQFFGSITGIATGAGYSGTISTGYGLVVAAPILPTLNKIINYTGLNINNNTDNGGNTAGTINNYQLQIGGNTTSAGSGGTLNNYGINVTQPSGNGGTTNNYGVYIQGNGSAVSGLNYSLYNTSTAASLFTGNVGIGTAPTLASLQVKATSGDVAVLGDGSVTNRYEFNVDSGSGSFLAIHAGVAGVVSDAILGLRTGSGSPLKLQETSSSNEIWVQASTGTISTGNSAIATSNIIVRSGNSTTSGNTGTLVLGTGNATSGNSGALGIDTGTASGATGAINIGAANASSISIGKSGSTNLTSIFGNTSLKSASSTSAFLLQSSTGTQVINYDSSGLILTIGTATNNVSFGSTFEPVLAGTARHAKTIVLTPEYAGAALDAASDAGGAVNCSTANTGTMTSGFASATRQNYYNWTVPGATAQCYDVVLQVPVPNDWAAWNGAGSMFVYNSVGSDSTSVMADAYDTTGTHDSGFTAATYSGVTSTTTLASASLPSFSGTYAAGGYMTLKIRMTSASAKNVQIGNITLNYSSKF
jgi:hypothetical protein